MNSRQLSRSWPYPRHESFVRSLRKAASAWFNSKDFPVHSRYPYILADRDDWPRNIILPEVSEYIRKCQAERADAGKGFPLHKYIHHGLSSQALLFNLMGPLIVSNDLEPFRDLLIAKGFPWQAGGSIARFEYEDRRVFNEDNGQPTSVDLMIEDAESESSLFIECKLVETEFGGCSVFEKGDCDGSNPSSDFSRCYLHHLGRRYWELLETHGFLDGPLGKDSSCILASHYQFFREVLFAIEKGGTFILLSDERSPTFFCNEASRQRGLFRFLSSLVPEAVRPRIGSVCIRDIEESISDSSRHSWIEEFRAKYGRM